MVYGGECVENSVSGRDTAVRSIREGCGATGTERSGVRTLRTVHDSSRCQSKLSLEDAHGSASSSEDSDMAGNAVLSSKLNLLNSSKKLR